MEGKLIKSEYHTYILEDNNGNLIGSISDNGSIYKLSLKNCEAIANGYDLDELYEKVVNSDFSDKYEDGVHYYSFIEGFQRALEILSDKKFSEDDIKVAYQTGWNSCNDFLQKEYDDNFNPFELPDSIKKPSQQTEWDVIFNPDEKDVDGCLILKKINKF
jgi:hypothetical protein